MRNADFQLCLSKHFFNSQLKQVLPCFYLDKVSSTQDALKLLIQQGAPAKSSVFTFNQTKGRGRNQSVWQTLPGKHLFFSHAQHVKLPAKNLAKISLLIGAILRETLEKNYAISAKIKWPNDLYINDKKLSGILCENFQVNSRQLLIIGIGINIDNSSSKKGYSSFKPAYAQNYTAKTIQKWELLGLVLNSLDHALQDVETKLFLLQEEFKKHDYLYNKTITVQTGDTQHNGKAKGINEDGALIIKKETGKTVPIYSGHVVL